MRHFPSKYNADGKEQRRAARERAGFRCIRCNHPHDPKTPGRILTTHHFDGHKDNDAWWNLLALCAICHLKIQGKVDPHIPFFLPHSDWIKPFVAGFYAHKYEGKMLSREEVEARLDELLAYELATV